jgi:hypothetical protein
MAGAHVRSASIAGHCLCGAALDQCADGSLWINSFAHGRTVYDLRLDARVRAAMDKASDADVVKTFVRLAIAADLNDDEIEELRNEAAKRTGIAERTIGRALDAARREQAKRRAEEARERRLAERRDPRPEIAAPHPDDPWLPADVATSYAGKCTLIATALTIIERSLLPDRPCFFVTAGRRGGGKTTTLAMLITAVMGVRPCAAAWSANEEERRKALLSYFLDGAAYILWDNIPRGCQISCPHIEKSCTIANYTDRKLGVSETVATSASTIHLIYGE